MAVSHDDLMNGLRGAVRHFWTTRKRQAKTQGAKSGERDRGARSAVTGGAHLDGFAELIRKLIVDAGISDTAVHRRTRVELPGYYRAEKKWDRVFKDAEVNSVWRRIGAVQHPIAASYPRCGGPLMPGRSPVVDTVDDGG
jgi:hypothetical protein